MLVLSAFNINTENCMPTKVKPWTPGALRTLHRGSEKHTPVVVLSRMLKRSAGAIRQKARSEGLSIGVSQRGVATRVKRYQARRRLGLTSAAYPTIA